MLGMKHWILTNTGIINTDGEKVKTPFDGKLVHHGQFGQEVLAVIVDRHEIWFYDGTWFKKAESDLSLNCLLWTQQGLLIGTAEARLAWLHDDELEFITSFDEVSGRSNWTTPGGWAPDVRSLALDHNGTIYADIHVGWIVRSTDGGVTWEQVTEGLDKDVHQVNSHPTENGIVTAATARGFYISQDSGMSFKKRWDGFRQTYQRATDWFVGSDTILVSVSDGPHSNNARLYRSEDHGVNWKRVQDIPDKISTNINTYQITTADTGLGFVIVENSSIYQTKDHGKTWQVLVEDLPKTYQVVELP